VASRGSGSSCIGSSRTYFGALQNLPTFALEESPRPPAQGVLFEVVRDHFETIRARAAGRREAAGARRVRGAAPLRGGWTGSVWHSGPRNRITPSAGPLRVHRIGRRGRRRIARSRG